MTTYYDDMSEGAALNYLAGLEDAGDLAALRQLALDISAGTVAGALSVSGAISGGSTGAFTGAVTAAGVASSAAVQAAAGSGFVSGASGPKIGLSGTGSPEGVVSAPVGSTYIDTAATTGAIRWIKASGTGNTGWVVEYGDTGQRNLNAITWDNGWASYGAGGQRLRRIGNVVNMRLEVTKASATADDVYTLPVGFRPAMVVQLVWATGAGDDYCTAYVTSGGAVNITRSVATSNVIYGYVQYLTADAWPTSLPGSAA